MNLHEVDWAKVPARLPIIQAPMAGVQGSALAIAVAKGGGVGSLPCAMLSSDALSRELATIRASGCSTYNLNFFCHPEPTPDEAREARWRSALAPYYLEHKIDQRAIVKGAARTPFSAEHLAIIAPYKPPIVSFHFGLPRRDWLEDIKSWGGRVWSSATTPEEASWLAGHGADAVIAQGIEAGGHRGMFLTQDLASQTSTLALLRAIKNTTDIPVIAAGGMANPEHVAKAMDAGAWAVQIGTSYLCCTEASTSSLHRSLLLQRKPSPKTYLTNLLSGRPARGIMNRLMQELGPLSEIAPEFPGAAAALAPLRAAAEKQGKTDFSPLWCGTDASGCREVDACTHTQWLGKLLT